RGRGPAHPRKARLPLARPHRHHTARTSRTAASHQPLRRRGGSQGRGGRMSEYFYYTTPDHPLAEPLVTQLTAEYDRRYGTYFGEPAENEMNRYPPALFAPPEGNFLLLLRDGFPIAGGAFKRYDEDTAELKRIWTDENHRRQG